MYRSMMISAICVICACVGAGESSEPHAKQSEKSLELNSTNSFPFVIPWDDTLAGTATDVSFLNAKPAGVNGHIIAKQGVFIESGSRKRVRFLGTNLGASAAFPLKEEAPIIAKHLAKMGINIVRFHHLQNDWDKEYGMIWKKGKEQMEFDPVQIDRLDFFIAELKKQGIYTNMNLQTTRKMIPELGIPASAMEIPNFQKKVDKLNRKMISLQKQYAKDLLDRKNPYTGLKYKDDPALMVLEINNENSLVGWPGEQPGAGLEKWPEPFQSELRSRWNEWLLKKYRTTTALSKAWPNRDTRKASSATTASSKWTWENQSNGDATFETSVSQVGAPTLVAQIKSNAGPSWHIQAHLGGLNLEDGKVYTVQFDGKADRELGLNIDSRLDKPDWRFLGLGGSVKLTTAWKNYALSFTASGTEPNHARVGFVLGDVRGKIEIKNLTIREGTLETGLEPGQTLEKRNVAIPNAGASPKFQDYARFLTETESRYSLEMRNYLRDELGFKNANIIDSQIAWGGLSSVIREKPMEFADNHEYWQHPTFLGGEWDPKNYVVERKSVVNDPELGTLKNLSLWRVNGKPYSVSEYCHPAPNDFQSEMMPLYAGIGAMQNWDILYTFAWEATGKREKNDMYTGYFDFARNPAKKAFFPSAALLFRLGLLDSNFEFEPINVTESSYLTQLSPQSLVKSPDILKKRYGIVTADKLLQTKLVGRTEYTEGRILGQGEQRIVVLESDQAIVFAGFVGGKTITTKVGTFEFGNIPSGFASVMLVPRDGLPLKESEDLLLTVIGRVENQNMKWNAARNSVSDQWGNGPTVAEIIPVKVTLSGFKSKDVFALDGTGKTTRRVGESSSFQIGKDTKSAWYQLKSN